MERELKYNVFLQTLRSLHSELVLPIIIANKYGNKTFTSDILTSSQNYLNNVAFPAVSTTNLLIQMNISLLYLSDFSNLNKLKQSKIDDSDTIIYYTENFFIRYTGFLDRVLHIVNQIYELSIVNKKVKPEYLLITGNNLPGKLASKITEKNINLFNKLVNIQQEINKSRLIRNNITHYSSFTDDNIFYLILLNLKNKYSNSLNHNDSNIDSIAIINNHKEKLEIFFDNLENLWLDISIDLNKIFLEIYKKKLEEEKNG